MLQLDIIKLNKIREEYPKANYNKSQLESLLSSCGIPRNGYIFQSFLDNNIIIRRDRGIYGFPKDPILERTVKALITESRSKTAAKVAEYTNKKRVNKEETIQRTEEPSFIVRRVFKLENKIQKLQSELNFYKQFLNN